MPLDAIRGPKVPVKGDGSINLLVPYIRLPDHQDPLLEEFTYGDIGARGKKLESLKRGDYLFFHTPIKGRKYITAYYVVDRVIEGKIARNDNKIITEYKNPHVHLVPSKVEKYENDVIVFGDPETSRILEPPLLFDRSLAQKLSLNIRFPDERTESQAIGSSTRSWRELTNEDLETLFEAIKSLEAKTLSLEKTMLSDEVSSDLTREEQGLYFPVEDHLRDFLVENLSTIKVNGLGIKLFCDRNGKMGKEYPTDIGDIDILAVDEKGDLVVFELKVSRGSDRVTGQISRYMGWVKKHLAGDKSVKGVIVVKNPDKKLQYAVSANPNITLFEYEISFGIKEVKI